MPGFDAIHIDTKPIEEMRLALRRRGANDKQIDRATAAGYRGVSALLARNLRREVRKAGHRKHAKAVAGQVRRKRRGIGTEFTLRVGVRKNVDQAYTWHLLNLGAKPHYQPNAWRVIEGRLVKIEGGAQHPGFKGDPMRDRAFQKTSLDDVMTRFDRGFERTALRELRKDFAK